MTVHTRVALEAIPAYVPGRRPDDLGGDGERRIARLASNEMPFGPLPGVLAAMVKPTEESNRYPDFHRTQLCAAIAGRLGVDPEQVTASTGSVALLGHLMTAVADAGDEVLIGWRSFEAYLTLAIAVGAVPVRVPLDEYTHDLSAMAAAVTDRTRMIIVCNPNNPTGTVVATDELQRFLESVPPHVLVVLDEAYIEFTDDEAAPDSIELCRQHPNLAILRTFSKAYGLAGLRVGYSVSHRDLADVLRKVQTPFGVNSVAEAAARASLEPAALIELSERIELIRDERERVSAVLRAHGMTVPLSQSNFIYLPLADGSDAFAEACEEAGVLVRAYTGDGVRITIGLPEENDAFLAVAVQQLQPTS